MCRLAFFPSGTRLDKSVLTDFLKGLEKSFGGDGNGFAAISPSQTLTLRKAVGLDCEDISNEIYDLMNLDWAVYFHTRKTSIGYTTDEQCHPFAIKGPHWIGTLCHNGTWSKGETLARYFDVGSDTAAFAKLIGELGLKEIERRKLMPESGVFLLYGAAPGEKPQHSVLKIAGSLEYCPETKIWASEFPRTWEHWAKTYTVKTGSHSLLSVPEKLVYTNNYTNSYYGNKNYTSGGFYQSPSNNNKSLTSHKDDAFVKDLWNGEDRLTPDQTDEKLWADRYWYHASI